MTSQISNEPSKETYAAVGKLCAGWSFVEMLSERTLWGIMGLDASQAQAFVWRLQLPQRWQMIVREGKKKLNEEEAEELQKLKKMVDRTQSDRNVVVHGVIHASMLREKASLAGEKLAEAGKDNLFERQPCWTIFIGDNAGKNYPVSTEAIDTINSNIVKIQEMIKEFNHRKGYLEGTPLAEDVERDWPKLL